MLARDEAEEIPLEELEAAGEMFDIIASSWLERLLETARRGVSLARCSPWSERSRPGIYRVQALGAGLKCQFQPIPH